MAGKQAQSAMEYLITYGWAILVLGISISALYILGVFSSTPSSFAQAGSCQVYRPDGQNTTEQIALSGLCNGLPPFAVAQFNGNSAGFVTQAVCNGETSTITAWVYLTSLPSSGQYATIAAQPADLFGIWPKGCGDTLEVDSSGDLLFTAAIAGPPAGLGHYSTSYFTADNPSVISANKWYFVVGEIDGSNVAPPTTPFLGNAIACAYPSTSGCAVQAISVSGGGALQGATGNVLIGSFNSANYIAGYMSNVQYYTSALSANSVNAIYAEGIGGAPININALTGWWPLNQNTNDYSGQEEPTITESGVGYKSQWISITGYTVP